MNTEQKIKELKRFREFLDNRPQAGGFPGSVPAYWEFDIMNAFRRYIDLSSDEYEKLLIGEIGDIINENT